MAHKGDTASIDEHQSTLAEELSSVQKRLEDIIRKDEKMRKHMTPILTNMQFSEIMRQHMHSIEGIWNSAVNALNTADETEENWKNNSPDLIRTRDERVIYYPLILNCEAPSEDLQQDQQWIDDLLEGL